MLLDLGREVSNILDMARERRSKMGRPAGEIPADATFWRIRLRLSPTILARLDEARRASARPQADEIAEALRAYLALPDPPAPSEVDESHKATRVQLPAALVRRLDERTGNPDAREVHVVAAVERWLAIGDR